MISRQEAIRLGMIRYFTGKPCQRAGHISERWVANKNCVKCGIERSSERNKKNRDHHNAIHKRYRERAGEAHRKIAREAMRRYRETPHGSAYLKNWNRMRKKGVKDRTPPWADIEEIREFYANCPDGYEVDHVIPLHGKGISGLHVAYNLQYLKAEENRRKGNRVVG